MTAVLRHVIKNRPHWLIDYQADRGSHSAMLGLVRNAISYDEPLPCSEYEREIQINLYDTFACWEDRPNTRVSQCLHERFGMKWEAELGRYQINVGIKQTEDAYDYLHTLTQYRWNDQKFPIVCIQYEGDSAQHMKNLNVAEAAEICAAVMKMGRIPLLMDWRNRSPIPNEQTIHTTGRMAVSSEWGRDAQMNAAIISQCEAFIGIDSGPGKCATATDTPTLICWTGNHPALFHDPSPNTTHLVPENHRSNPLLQGNKVVADWFENNYLWQRYFPGELVWNVKKWLKETLK